MITTLTKGFSSIQNNLILVDQLAIINFNDNAIIYNNTFFNVSEVN